MKQYKGIFIIGIITALLCILIMTGYNIYFRTITESLQQLRTPSYSVTPISSVSSITLTGDKKIYKNNEIEISFSYPKDLLLGEESGDNDNPVKKIYIGDVSSQVAQQKTDGIHTPFTITFWSEQALIDFDFTRTKKSKTGGAEYIKKSTFNSFIPESRKIESVLVGGKEATKYSGLYTDYFAMDNTYHSEIMLETEKGLYTISSAFTTAHITVDVMENIISTIMWVH